MTRKPLSFLALHGFFEKTEPWENETHASYNDVLFFLETSDGSGIPEDRTEILRFIQTRKKKKASLVWSCPGKLLKGNVLVDMSCVSKRRKKTFKRMNKIDSYVAIDKSNGMV